MTLFLYSYVGVLTALGVFRFVNGYFIEKIAFCIIFGVLWPISLPIHLSVVKSI